MPTKVTGMAKKLNWGIIGCGGIADRRTIPGIMKSEIANLYAVMDRSPAVTDKVAQKYGNAKAYYTAEELLADPMVDAVYIATPLCAHYEQAMATLRAGKHLLMEKPMAMTSAECREILALAEEKDLALSVGFIMRQHSLHQKMRDIVREGGIGQLVSMYATFSCWYPDIPGAWRQQKAFSGGGSFMDLGVHCLDLLQYVSGQEFTEIKAFAETQSFQYEVDDSAAVLARTASGALGVVTTNFNVPDHCGINSITLLGTKGSLVTASTLGQEEAGTLEYIYAPQGDYDAMQGHLEPKKEIFKPEGRDLYLSETDAFAAEVLAGRRDYSLAKAGIHVQELTERIYGGC